MIECRGMATIALQSRATSTETRTYSVAKLLELMRSGRVRIPQFQRGLRWKDEDRRLLLDSLQAGYPVGTLLLAQGDAPAQGVTLGGYTIDAPASRDALWVVDGQQRLSVLAMAFLEERSATGRPIFFDLETNKFVLGHRRRTAPAHWVPTRVLASSANLNRWLRDKGMSEEFSDCADDIAQRIREYAIPAYLVPYDGEDDSLLKEIFARVNRQGRTLRRYEVFQALHRARDGGGDPLTNVVRELASHNFGMLEIPLVERSALAVGGFQPTGRLEDLVKEQEPVKALFVRVASGLAAAIAFLRDEVGVPCVQFLPYTGVLATLARFFDLFPTPDPRNVELLRRWFWRGTLAKVHCSDNAIDQKAWSALRVGDEHLSVQRLIGLLPTVTTNTYPLPLKAFRRGNAMDAVSVIALYALEPKTLVGDERGDDINIVSMLEDEVRVPLPIVEDDHKTLAAFILHEPIDVEQLVSTPPSAEVLASHAMDSDMIEALGRGDTNAFLTMRTTLIERHIRSFLDRYAALDTRDHDRAPIESYFEETA